jgi:hypothetical protein
MEGARDVEEVELAFKSTMTTDFVHRFALASTIADVKRILSDVHPQHPSTLSRQHVHTPISAKTSK